MLRRARMLKAVGDENRLKIMDLLKEEELCAGSILESLHIGQSTLSHHMKILCDSGIVSSRKESRWVYYKIDQNALAELVESLNEFKK